MSALPVLKRDSHGLRLRAMPLGMRSGRASVSPMKGLRGRCATLAVRLRTCWVAALASPPLATMCCAVSDAACVISGARILRVSMRGTSFQLRFLRRYREGRPRCPRPTLSPCARVTPMRITSVYSMQWGRMIAGSLGARWPRSSRWVIPRALTASLGSPRPSAAFRSMQSCK